MSTNTCIVVNKLTIFFFFVVLYEFFKVNNDVAKLPSMVSSSHSNIFNQFATKYNARTGWLFFFFFNSGPKFVNVFILFMGLGNATTTKKKNKIDFYRKIKTSDSASEGPNGVNYCDNLIKDSIRRTAFFNISNKCVATEGRSAADVKKTKHVV